MRVIRADTYQADLQKMARHVGAENPAAALDMIDRIENAIEQLSNFPYSGRTGRIRRTRELVISGTPYIVIYTVRSDVIAARILHGAQKWPKRLQLPKRQKL